MIFNTQAIILKRCDFREADLEVTFLSKDYGKIRAVAIGAKKITSKLAGNLEPWREVKTMLALGRQFDKVGQVVILNNFGIQDNFNLSALIQSQKAMALVDKIIELRQNEQGLYEFVKVFLSTNFLANFSQNSAKYAFFGWQLLKFSGWLPEVKKCVSCEQNLKIEKAGFDFENGGLICSNCLGDYNKIEKLSSSAVGWLKAIQQYPFEDLLAQPISLKTAKELEETLNLFVTYHLSI